MRNALRNDSSFERALAHRNNVRKQGKRKRQYQVESLEGRTLLTATLSVNGTGAVSFLSQTLGSTVGLSFNTGTNTYTFDDTEGVAAGTVAPAFTYTQVTGTEATLAPVAPATQNFTSLSFDQNVENISYNVTSLDTPTSFVDTSLPAPVGTPLTDSFDFGATGLAQSLITADVSVALTKEFAAITVDDSADTTAQVINVSSAQVDFNTTPAFNYASTPKVASLLVEGGSGGNTFNVNSTIGSGPTTLNTGTGADTVNAFASSAAALNINGQAGADTVTLGGLAGVGMQHLAGPINVTNATGSTTLVLDDSEDTTGQTATLTDNGTTGTVTGLSPATITYTDAQIHTLAVKYGSGTNTMTVDLSNDGHAHTLGLSSDGTTSTLSDALGNLPYAITYNTASLASLTIKTDGADNQILNLNFGGGGNPIPTADTPGLFYNGEGNGVATGTAALNVLGELPSGVFRSETHNANDQTVMPQLAQYGSIDFTDATGIATSLWYTGLQPINDTTPATLYTFNDDGFPDQSFSATDGPTVGGFNTLQFTNTPTPPTPLNFETTNVANKTNIVFNTPVATPPTGITGVVNIPTASTGLTSLAFNTPTNADNTVSFVATPPSVATSLVGGSAADVTNVTGKGLADSTTLMLNGGGGTNTLNYDAGGLTPMVSSPSAGVVLISLPGFGSVQATNYQSINITDLVAPVITAGPAVTINTVAGFQLVNAIVGTFTLPLPVNFPTPSFGFPASDFTATINWGDGTAAMPDTSAGTITQDASNPSVYDITGTHTFAAAGMYTIANTVDFSGGTLTFIVGGVPISITDGPAGPTPGNSATANVTASAIVAGTTPTAPTATVGTLLPSTPLVTFTTPSSALPATAYSATINWGDGSALSAGTISLTAGVYTVSGSHNYGETAGSPYTITVAIVGSGAQLTETTAATVAGLTVIAQSGILPTAGTPTGDLMVGNVSGTPTPDLTGYTALIDWGDGTTPSAGFIDPSVTGADNIVSSGHTYAQGGSYNLLITIRDSQGFLVGTAATVVTVSVTPLNGQISPQSVTGTSASGTSYTYDTTPIFVGNTAPGTTVEVFATPSGSAVVPGTQIAIGAANSAGYWAATVNKPLTDGSYTITAEAVNSSGTVLNTAALGTVVIDTVGPVITAVTFDRFTDTVTVTYQDNLSGLAFASIANGAFYHLSAKPLAKNVPVPKLLLPTAITITPGATATSPEVVNVVFNHGHAVRGGRYLIVINSGAGDTGIHDVAGNALDGNFYGNFPSGDGLPGGNFAASIDTFHNNIVLAPVPV
jgi:large repetitive protein